MLRSVARWAAPVRAEVINVAGERTDEPGAAKIGKMAGVLAFDGGLVWASVRRGPLSS
jgi:hypothetical protein